MREPKRMHDTRSRVIPCLAGILEMYNQKSSKVALPPFYGVALMRSFVRSKFTIRQSSREDRLPRHEATAKREKPEDKNFPCPSCMVDGIENVPGYYHWCFHRVFYLSPGSFLLYLWSPESGEAVNLSTSPSEANSDGMKNPLGYWCDLRSDHNFVGPSLRLKLPPFSMSLSPAGS